MKTRDVAVVLALAFAGCRSQEVVPASAPDRATVVRNAGRPQVESAWRGKKVAFLGDSITDPQHVGCTALHRGYAAFGPTNVQPDESFANLRGDFIGDFNDDIREAGRIWSVPVLDLFATSGLYPLDRQAYADCFHNAEKDMLHPSAEGHRRIARTMAGWMLTVPSDFKGE